MKKPKSLIAAFLMLFSMFVVQTSAEIAKEAFGGISSTTSSHDWPTFYHDFARKGYTSQSIQPPLKLYWSYSLENYFVSPPVIADGKVYFTGSTRRYEDIWRTYLHVFALDIATGLFLWDYSIRDPDINWGMGEPGNRPIVTVVDGTVFFSTIDIMSGPGYSVYALDADTGSFLWRSDVVETERAYCGWAPSFNSIAVDGGTVYVGGQNDGIVRAYDGKTGEQVWELKLPDPSVEPGMAWGWKLNRPDDFVHLFSPALSNGVVYVFGEHFIALPASRGGWDTYTIGVVHAIDVVSRSILWSRTTSNCRASNSGSAHVAVDNGLVYITSYLVHSTTPWIADWKLLALNANTGEIQWEYMMIDHGNGGRAGYFVIKNGVVYLPYTRWLEPEGYEHFLVALDASMGEHLWEISMDHGVRFLAGVDDTLYCSQGGQGLMAFDTISREAIWSYPIDYQTVPAIAENILFASSNSAIFAFHPDVDFDWVGIEERARKRKELYEEYYWMFSATWWEAAAEGQDQPLPLPVDLYTLLSSTAEDLLLLLEKALVAGLTVPPVVSAMNVGHEATKALLAYVKILLAVEYRIIAEVLDEARDTQYGGGYDVPSDLTNLELTADSVIAAAEAHNSEALIVALEQERQLIADLYQGTVRFEMIIWSELTDEDYRPPDVPVFGTYMFEHIYSLLVRHPYYWALGEDELGTPNFGLEICDGHLITLRSQLEANYLDVTNLLGDLQFLDDVVDAPLTTRCVAPIAERGYWTVDSVEKTKAEPGDSCVANVVLKPYDSMSVSGTVTVKVYDSSLFPELVLTHEEHVELSHENTKIVSTPSFSAETLYKRGFDGYCMEVMFSGEGIRNNRQEMGIVDVKIAWEEDSPTLDMGPGYILLTLASPANLLVTAPDGLRVGYDSSTGIIVNEIEGATYFGAGTEPQIITIPSPLPGAYTVDVFGTGTGTYTITIESVAGDGSIIDSETWTGTTSPGKLERSNIELLEDGSLVFMLEEAPVGGYWVPINKIELLGPWISLVSLATVAVISIVYIKRRKTKRRDARARARARGI